MWHKNLLAVLSRHGYDPHAAETLQELHARTGVSAGRLTLLLTGSAEATIHDIELVAAELNIPPGELLNADPSFLRVYSIDGSNPITVALPPNLLAYIAAAAGGALMYADSNDASYSGIEGDTVTICSRGLKDLVSGSLYLMETESARFIRRCVEARPSRKEAVFANGPGPDAERLVVNCEPVQVVSATSPLIMGQVLWTIDRV